MDTVYDGHTCCHVHYAEHAAEIHVEAVGYVGAIVRTDAHPRADMSFRAIVKTAKTLSSAGSVTNEGITDLVCGMNAALGECAAHAGHPTHARGCRYSEHRV